MIGRGFRRFAVGAALFAAAFLTACDIHLSGSVDTTPTPEEERVVREAFAVIRQGDVQKYWPLTITRADFIMRDNGLSDFHDQASVAGSVLKPEEQKQQGLDFEQASRNDPECIDFSSATFRSLGTLVRAGEIAMPEGKKLPFKEWSVVIGGPGGEVDTKDMSPRFVLVEWTDGPRILALRFGHGSDDDMDVDDL